MPAEPIRTHRASTAGPFSIREIAYAPGLRQPRHAHDYMGITIVLGGTIRENVGPREAVGGALSVVVKPVGVEHANEVGRGGARTLQVAFDPAVVAQLGATAGLGAWRWSHAGDAAAPLLALARGARHDVGRAELEQLVVDALASLTTPLPLREAPGWLRRVRESLDDGAEHGSVRALAAEAGVHEVTLSRAFRECFGCTISEYRRRARLAHAARTIAGTRDSLTRAAYEVGYADHAHMCREFRRGTGLTPSQYRDLARS